MEGLFGKFMKWEQFETCSYSKPEGEKINRKRDVSGIAKQNVIATKPVTGLTKQI